MHEIFIRCPLVDILQLLLDESTEPQISVYTCKSTDDPAHRAYYKYPVFTFITLMSSTVDLTLSRLIFLKNVYIHLSQNTVLTFNKDLTMLV